MTFEGLNTVELKQSENKKRINNLLNIFDRLSGGQNVSPIVVAHELPVHLTKFYKTRSLNKIKRVVVHCTDRNWSVEQVAAYDVQGQLTYIRPFDGKEITDINHISKTGLPGITYHSCVDFNSVYHTLDYDKISWHAAGYNSSSLAVALLYRATNPNTKKDSIKCPDHMIKMLQCHVGDICLQRGLQPKQVVGHRELRGTGWEIIKGRRRLLKTCPGMSVNMDKLRHNISIYMQTVLGMRNLYHGKIDGIFGKKSIEALKQHV